MSGADGTRSLGLNPSALARLLEIGTADDASPRTPEQIKGQLVTTLLAMAVPNDPAAAARTADFLLPAADEAMSVGHALLDPGVGLETLVRLKEYGKQLTSGSTDANRRLAAAAIYNGAIAAAAAHLGQKISAHPWESLATSFKCLAQEPWMPARLAGLFAQAQKACQGRTGG